MSRSTWSRFGFAWVTGGFFLVSLIGHWLFGWFAYVQEQQSHQQPVELYGYLILMMRDTLENWQSEFLQLLWQVGGLALLLYVGSPQSKEVDDRIEAKLDAILRAVDRDEADRPGEVPGHPTPAGVGTLAHRRDRRLNEATRLL